MMNEEKIRKYLEGELSIEELKNFEDEINHSPSLKNEINAYRRTLNKFISLGSAEVDDKYFINILPHFREKKVKQKQTVFKPSFAIGSIVLILITAAIFFIINNNQGITEDGQITLQNLTPDELNEYLNSYSQEISTSQLIEDIPEGYDSLFSAMIDDELSLDNYPGDYFVDVSNNEFYNIIDELSEEELEGIYNSLIKEDFN